MNNNLEIIINKLSKPKNWFYHFIYLTQWVIILSLFVYVGFFKKYQYSILLLLILAFIGGFVLVYIYPKYIKFKFFGPDRNIEISGRLIHILNILIHCIPLLLFIIFYDVNRKRDSGLFFIFVIVLYLILYNPFYIYDFN